MSERKDSAQTRRKTKAVYQMENRAGKACDTVTRVKTANRIQARGRWVFNKELLKLCCILKIFIIKLCLSLILTTHPSFCVSLRDISLKMPKYFQKVLSQVPFGGV